jgi:DNA-binding transcriptional LysR family regulator
MVAVRIGPDMRMAEVGSPAYFARRPPPRTPQDLAEHVCIGLRYASQGGIGVWDFDKAGRAVNVRIQGQLIVNNIALARLAALQGVGLAYLPEEYAAPSIGTGALVRVLARIMHERSGAVGACEGLLAARV